MTAVVSGGFRWIADRDAIAHAHRDRGRQVRTLCNLPAIDERFGRPAAVRCQTCAEVIQGTSQKPSTPAIQLIPNRRGTHP